MPKITKIEEHKKYKDRVNIFIDNEFFAVPFKELVSNAKLQENMEINNLKILELIIKEDIYYKAREKALKLIYNSIQKEEILEDILYECGFDENIIKQILIDLKNNNLLKIKKKKIKKIQSEVAVDLMIS